MQKPMNPSEEKKHMKQISIPLFSPAIAPERARSRRSRPPWVRDVFRNQRNYVHLGLKLFVCVELLIALEVGFDTMNSPVTHSLPQLPQHHIHQITCQSVLTPYLASFLPPLDSSP